MWGKTHMGYVSVESISGVARHAEGERGTHGGGWDNETGMGSGERWMGLGRDGHSVRKGGDGTHLVGWTFWGCITSKDAGRKGQSSHPTKAVQGQDPTMGVGSVLEPGWGL